MVIWSEPAKEDLKIIHNYISHDSHFYAQKVVNDIIEKTETLEQFSDIGELFRK